MSKLVNSNGGGSRPVTGDSQILLTGGHRDMSDVAVIGGAVAVLAISIGALWMYAERHSQEQGELTLSTAAAGQAPAGFRSESILPVAPPVSATTKSFPQPDQLHVDLFFDFDRTRLDEDAKTLLDERIRLVKRDPDWAMLVEGFADPSGTAHYNKALGLRRAETVKKYVLSQGVEDHHVKTVSLGSDAALCADGSPECRRLNRRVHVALIKVGAEHLAPPIQPLPVPMSAPAGDATETTTAPDIEPMPSAIGAPEPIGPMPDPGQTLTPEP